MKRWPPADLLCACNDPFRIHEREGKGPCAYGYTCGCRRFKVSFRMLRRWARERLARWARTRRRRA